ncbi:DUF2795 domain-containing protein [Gordonia sp. DT30]|uniref:DUF2795 domain-containing protein n=1 Tax=Gordonia sp. DT30 TaxID=3416546 RepID=UPI003CF28878
MSDVNPIALQKALGGISYPSSKDGIVKTAEGNGADDTVLSALRKLPDQQFTGPDDVQKAVF